MDIILKYFPQLTDRQKEQFGALYDLYTDWNAKINVISRKDIGNLYEHHVLHSLAIAKMIHFRPGTRIMDLGTGGGFPGIPLAILFPECHFHLVDSIGKKIRVATEVASAIHLENVTLRHCRAEEERELFDFVVSRAVMPLADLVDCHEEHCPRAAERLSQRAHLPQGRRAAARGHALQAPHGAVRPEHLVRGGVFPDEEGGVRVHRPLTVLRLTADVPHQTITQSKHTGSC